MTRPSLPKRQFRYAVTVLVVAGALLSALGLGNSPNGLVINEVFDSQNVASEYFELYNTSTAAINLSTYVIYNRDGNTPLSNLADPNIAPGQIRAIGPSQLGTPTIAGSGLARTDFLGLVNTSPSDQVIDVVNYNGPPDISWPNYERFRDHFFPAGTFPTLTEDAAESLQRWPDGHDTDQGSDFQKIDRSPGAFSCSDPFEDDNTLNSAVAQNPGTEVLHRICPSGDADYVAITMSTSITYTLQVTAVGTRIDTVLRLFDTNGV